MKCETRVDCPEDEMSCYILKMFCKIFGIYARYNASNFQLNSLKVTTAS